MTNFGEHIEAMIELYEEAGDPLDPDDIAESVLDIVFAQGLIQESELELGHKQIADEVRYMLA
jgi:hypothetical protein